MKKSHLRDDVSVITLVDSIISEAIEQAASDIHIDPTLQGLKIRFRIDGVLHDQGMIKLEIMSNVISRIKLLSHIDIAERRVPQDGKFQVLHHGKTIDLRVATFPSVYGEKIVIRILDTHSSGLVLEQLGFQEHMLAMLKKLINRPSGFFLVSGPTGSGKTTTLYAILNALVSSQKHCITLEDPIEYRMQGITQSQVHPEAGFTFEKGMRALLRQDPDIVLIGEIRDKQTAQIALEAALTGHVVLSTIHTNDAPSVIMRLMDMGIEPFLLNAAITGVFAQRLARRLCPACKYSAIPTESEQQILQAISPHGIDMVYHSYGCDACNNRGYKGRTGIFQALETTPSLRSLIVKQPSFDAIVQQARFDGMHSLLHDGVLKVQQGIITLSELLRVAV